MTSRNPWDDGPATHPLVGLDIPTLLRLQARSRADHPFVVWEPFEGVGRTWTYASFARASSALAAGLSSRGVRLGDHVIIHLDNCPEFLLAWFACAQVGAVAVTTNTHSAADEFGYFADDSRAVAVITQPKYAELVGKSAKNVSWIAVTDTDSGGDLPAGGTPDGTASLATLRGDPNDGPRRAPDPWARLSVQYTSGSTSRPKGVLWTHANGLWGAKINARHEDLRPDDIHLVYAPLFHTNALAYSTLASLWAGSTIVLIPKWTTSRFWDISVRNRCTWLSIVGYAGAVFTSEPPPDHHYRLWGTGACDLAFDATFGVKTIGWWGMTETISHGIVGDPFVPDRSGSMGRPAPEYLISVVGDDGREVEAGREGELRIKGIRGLSLFAEYLNQPEATKDSFTEDGWFLTGDRVTPGADGYIDFAGRSKEMLKVGGENVAALEVERVIMSVPGIAEAAVISKGDPMLAEVPVAYVVATDDDPSVGDRVIEACAAGLADFKVPREVHVVTAFPRVTIGKIDKNELRRALEEGRDPIVKVTSETPEN